MLPELVGNEQWDIRDRATHTPRQLAALVRDLRTCDLVFSWQGRIDLGPFLLGARTLGAKKIVIFWCGSDVLRAQKLFQEGKKDSWVMQQIHWAASPSLAEEVRALGVDCEYVQASFVRLIERPAPLPAEFSVLVFLPRPDLAKLYGWDQIVEVARSLPNIKFNLVGLREGQVDAPSNVRIHRWISSMSPIYDQTTVLWRPARHDAGIAFMVLEAMSHGRHVLYTYPVRGAVQVKNASEALAHLKNLSALHAVGELPLNEMGRESIANIYQRDVVRDDLRRRWEEIILA